MKKKNTFITALIALFIVCAGVESVSADVIVVNNNSIETPSYKPYQEYIDKFISEIDTGSGQTKYYGDVAGLSDGIYYWGKNGELALYEPDTGLLSDPMLPNQRYIYEAKIESKPAPYHKQVYFIAEYNKSKGYDSFEKVREGMKKSSKTKSEYHLDELVFVFNHRDNFDLDYMGDVARNEIGIFYWGKAGELAWYEPETGKVLDPVTERISEQSISTATNGKYNFEGGDQAYAEYIAELNKRRGYDSLEKIKEGMTKQSSAARDRYKIHKKEFIRRNRIMNSFENIPFEKRREITKYIGNIQNKDGIFYWGKTGELAWYNPDTDDVLDPLDIYKFEEITKTPFNASLFRWGVYVAIMNKTFYDSIEEIKDGLKKDWKKIEEDSKKAWNEYLEEIIADGKYANEKGFRYIGDVARNNIGVFYWGEKGNLAWYYPETGDNTDPVAEPTIARIAGGSLESVERNYANYVAEINKRRGYDSLEKIKEGMKKPKSNTTIKAEEVPTKKSEEPLKKQENELKEKKVDESTNKKEEATTQKQGWVQENGKWFYYDQSNNKQSGWVQVNGAWYYLAQDGEMKTGWLNQGDSWYYLTDSGSMKTGWQKVNGTWYYLNGSGAMQTGWLNQSGTWYYLNSSGSMQTGWLRQSGTWYYLTDSGSMKTGWYQVNTTWYYSYSSGALAVSTTVDGYTVNANGEWI